jgi:PAS domain S-box-containing protein
LIVSKQLIARDFLLLSKPYIEPLPGPLGSLFFIYAISAVAALFYHWIAHRRTQKEATIFLIGFVCWTLLAIHDGLVALGMPSVQYLLIYGYLGFILCVISTTTKRFRELYEVAASSKKALQEEIEKHKETEGALVKSQKHLAFVTDMVPALISHIDANERILFANLAYTRFFGLSREEIIGRKISEILTPDVYQESIPNRSRVLIGNVVSLETEIPNKSGSIRRMNVTMIPSYSADGSVDSYVTLLQDITRRTQAERALVESEARYRLVAENLRDVIWTLDLEGRCTYVSPSVIRLLGYTAEESRTLPVERQMKAESLHRVQAAMEAVHAARDSAAADDLSVSLEAELCRKDGSTVWAELSISQLRSESGEVVGVLGISRDITERRKADEALRQAKLEAEDASQAKSVFLANMSHEVRTPLNAIVGMTELFMDTELDQNQRSIILTIGSETSSLLDIVNDILDFSKIEAGKLDLEEIPFDLRSLIDGLGDTAALRAKQKRLEVISFVPSSFPATVLGDPSRLRQVLTNLISNAFKFTSVGEIFIGAEIVEEHPDSLLVRFEVRDTGIGISKERQRTIFDSFTQADGSTTREYGGTGLGTTISKQIVELMGGRIGVQSELAMGSTFWFNVDFKRSGVPEIPSREWAKLNGDKVLLITDNLTVMLVLDDYLRYRGCQPIGISDTDDAIAILREAARMNRPFSFFLIEESALRKIGAELPDSTPVIVLLPTARRLRSRGRAGSLGAASLLSKPVKRDDLYRAVDEALGISTPIPSQQLLAGAPELSGPERRRHKEMQILLVEDYPTNQQVALAHLRSAGYQVDLVEDGAQAVAAFHDKEYSLLLMDIQMPVMDGFEATRQIRKLELEAAPDGRRVPIIAMTAHAMAGYRDRCLAAGMDDYVTKPLRRRELLATVDEWTGAGGDSSAEPAPNATSEQPIQTNPDREPMNLSLLLDELEGNRDLAREVTEGFVGRLREQIGTLRSAIADGNGEVIRREAHKIKGGAANLAADRLASIAAELEELVGSGKLSQGAALVGRMEAECAKLAEHLRTALGADC